jgi:hypothetical protein
MEARVPLPDGTFLLPSPKWSPHGPLSSLVVLCLMWLWPPCQGAPQDLSSFQLGPCSATLDKPEVA